MSIARTDNSTLGRWWWTIDRWTLLALIVLSAGKNVMDWMTMRQIADEIRALVLPMLAAKPAGLPMPLATPPAAPPAAPPLSLPLSSSPSPPPSLRLRFLALPSRRARRRSSRRSSRRRSLFLR